MHLKQPVFTYSETKKERKTKITKYKSFKKQEI